MKYQQLIQGKKYQISALLGQEISVSKIARTLNCHKATIYRELKWNKKTKEYCPDKAQRAFLIKRKATAKYSISSKMIDFVRILIEIDWSPEQVSNVLKNCAVPVSHEWIYQYIHEDKRNTEERIHLAMRRINNRPRKCLGFKQPAMVFKEMSLVA